MLCVPDGDLSRLQQDIQTQRNGQGFYSCSGQDPQHSTEWWQTQDSSVHQQTQHVHTQDSRQRQDTCSHTSVSYTRSLVLISPEEMVLVVAGKKCGACLPVDVYITICPAAANCTVRVVRAATHSLQIKYSLTLHVLKLFHQSTKCQDALFSTSLAPLSLQVIVLF